MGDTAESFAPIDRKQLDGLKVDSWLPEGITSMEDGKSVSFPLPNDFPDSRKLLHILGVEPDADKKDGEKQDKGDKKDAKNPGLPEKDFQQAIRQLDSDDFDEREKGSRTLMDASLKQLIDFQTTAKDLSPEQQRRLDGATQWQANKFWEGFTPDSLSQHPEVVEPQIAKELLSAVPAYLKGDDSETNAKVEKLWGTGPVLTAQDMKYGLHLADQQVAFSDWLNLAAAQTGADDTVKESAKELGFQGALANLRAAEGHFSLAQADAAKVSDPKSLTREERDLQMKSALTNFRKLFTDDVHYMERGEFAGVLEDFYNSGAIGEKEFDSIVQSATDRALKSPINPRLSSDDRFDMLLNLATVDKVPPPRAKVVEAQIHRLTTSLKERLKKISDPKEKLQEEEVLIDGYHMLGRNDDARRVYEEAKATIEDFSQEERAAQLKLLKGEWDHRLK